MGERGDVDMILPHLDVFVLSSKRESYPRSAREALACGVPVILPAIGGCGEIISSEDAGLLFQSGDHADLAKQLDRILTEEAVPGERSKKARKHAETNFPLSHWRNAMDQLYRGAILEGVRI